MLVPPWVVGFDVLYGFWDQCLVAHTPLTDRYEEPGCAVDGGVAVAVTGGCGCGGGVKVDAGVEGGGAGLLQTFWALL